MQTLAESEWQRKCAVVSDEHENIPSSVEDGRAMTAVSKMQLERFPHLGRDVIVDVVRQFSLNFLAV
jgi:hypothetical protein